MPSDLSAREDALQHELRTELTRVDTDVAEAIGRALERDDGLLLGGAWSGGAEGQAAETVLDLARGREGSPARGSSRALTARNPRERSGHWPAGKPAEGEGGVSCRAS